MTEFLDRFSTSNALDSSISRRRLLIAGALISAIPKTVRAQNTENLSTMSPLFSGALEVQNFALEIPTESVPFNLVKFADFELTQRRIALSAMRESGLFQNYGSFREYLSAIQTVIQFCTMSYTCHR